MAKDNPPPSFKKSFNPQDSLGFAYRLGIELISGIIAGLLLGYAIDHVWGTQPWGLVIMVLFGFGAGLLTVFRISGLWGAPSGRSPSLPSDEDNEEKDG